LAVSRRRIFMSPKKKVLRKTLPSGGTVSPSRGEEAPAADWDEHYATGRIPWRSLGLSDISRRFLREVQLKGDILEIGCGLGDDAAELIELGFRYHGIDLSRTAIAQAAERLKGSESSLIAADVLTWTPERLYAVVYEKGVFQGMGGSRRRRSLVRRVKALLPPGGIWITVCGAADDYDRRSPRGAIFLTHLVEAVERDFEILQIEKGPYGLRKPASDFLAWYGKLRRRTD